MQQLLQVPAPAKLNLFLHVVGRRDDGYHLLQSVFTFVSLYDYLDFTLRTDGQIERVGQTIVGLAPEDDLIVRAARLLQQHTGTRYGVSIRCDKHIPSGAGLGGGSSNAATTLIALNKLWDLGLSRQELIQLGVQLGADVPIFLFGQSAFVEGIGDVLQPVEVPNYHYLLVKPTVSVPTPIIFRDKGLTRNTNPVIITDFTDYQAKAVADANGSVPLFGSNGLESVACKYAPDISILLQALHKQKLHARMTGSGSCLFVAYSDESKLTRQSNNICGTILLGQPAMQNQFTCWTVSGLYTHPLHNWLTDLGISQAG